jgi:WD40 repeat protein
MKWTSHRGLAKTLPWKQRYWPVQTYANRPIKMLDYKKRNYLSFGLISVLVAAISLMLLTISSVLAERVWSVDCSGCTQGLRIHILRTIPQPHFVTSVVWSPDGRYLSVGSLFEQNIVVYDTSDWKVISSFQRDRPAGNNNSVIQFINDSNNIIAPRIKEGSIWNIPPNNWNVSIQEWNIESGSISKNFPAIFDDERTQPYGLEEKDSEAKATAVSANNALIAASVGGSQDGHILIYRTSDSKILHDILCERYNIPAALAFSQDNRDLAVGGCTLNRVSIYDVQSGGLLSQTTVDEVDSNYNFILYNRNDDLIAVGSSGYEYGMVYLLNASNGSIVSSIPRAHATISNLQWLSNDRILVSYDAWHPDGSIAKIWDIKSLKVLAQFGGRHLQIVSINHDETLLAAVIGSEVIIAKIQQKSIGGW